ncbi:GNAT family N-acetyltransferase [Halorhabdus tiamatea]|uniref:GCN5-related N-acetyltransferase n=1 Tax=Halorhabdus tiamatea SARL4B TaxID=1033806 RepID=F7PGH5_9EURY|nr:GNAT family N-acetyltransferase [Halorhabdus tiamatea]CCQ33864.1 GCN5-related N-acetyltransferase [Halorhabdus tiamatea SARL4B]
MAIRRARATDLVDVLNVLDGADLATDHDRVQTAIERGDVFVAVPDEGQDDSPVVGALVLDGDEIANIAVRRRRRDLGIGTALVERAMRDRDRLVAEFDAGVEPFYESLGFDVKREDDARYRGVWLSSDSR